jgi:putative hydrolase of the HAD superfamily
MVILLDLFNTLVPGGDRNRAAVTRAMAGDLGVDPDRYVRLFFETWPERVTGELGDLPATVRILAERLGGNPSEAEVDKAVARRLDLTRQLLRPTATTLTALDALRAKGHRLGLVSNCTSETPAAWALTPLAVRLDSVTFSCVLGAGKPDPRIYLAACQSLDVEPADCVYVGDGADRELPAAVALGMRTIQTTEHQATDGNWPGERIAGLSELTALPTSGPRHR